MSSEPTATPQVYQRTGLLAVKGGNTIATGDSLLLVNTEVTYGFRQNRSGGIAANAHAIA